MDIAGLFDELSPLLMKQLETSADLVVKGIVYNIFTNTGLLWKEDIELDYVIDEGLLVYRANTDEPDFGIPEYLSYFFPDLWKDVLRELDYAFNDGSRQFRIEKSGKYIFITLELSEEERRKQCLM